MSDAARSAIWPAGDSVLGAVRLDGHTPHVIAAPVIAVRCHYCWKFVRPGEHVRIGQSVIMCWGCEEKHRKKILGLEPPKECQACHTPSELIAQRTPGNRWRMFIHWRDSEYQWLCEPCSDAYIGKRKDLYGRTQFGWDLKLF